KMAIHPLYRDGSPFFLVFRGLYVPAPSSFISTSSEIPYYKFIYHINKFLQIGYSHVYAKGM
ncbi:hypothetical protein, partial [Salinicoccus roseus]|uniref:hypothetical protein n=1 Tax=Salinicoccus roseus TaxID=45670 RepID=UPI00230102B4